VIPEAEAGDDGAAITQHSRCGHSSLKIYGFKSTEDGTRSAVEKSHEGTD